MKNNYPNLIASILFVLFTLLTASCNDDGSSDAINSIADDGKRPEKAKVVINSDEEQTDSVFVTLRLEAKDNKGVKAYFASESLYVPRALDGGWIKVDTTADLKTETVFKLSKEPGDKMVYVWFKDEDDNVSEPGQDNIELTANDITPPFEPSILINQGDISTDSQNLQLDLSAKDNKGIAAFLVSMDAKTPPEEQLGWIMVDDPQARQMVEGSVHSLEPPVEFTRTVYYNIPKANGEVTMTVWFADNGGNLSEASSDSILVDLGDIDRPYDPSILINGGDASTDDPEVNIRLKAKDETGITAYYLRESNTKPTADANGWTEVDSTTDFDLTIKYLFENVPAKKKVFAWFKDTGGNLSKTVGDSIVVGDIDAPVVLGVEINSGDSTTDDPNTVLHLQATDDTAIVAYYLSESKQKPEATDDSWTAVTPTWNLDVSTDYLFSNDAGVKKIFAWFKDEQGNISGRNSDTIELAYHIIHLTDRIQGQDQYGAWSKLGNSVDIDGDTAVVAANHNSNELYQSGSVFVFTKTNAGWQLQQEIKRDPVLVKNIFGEKVSLDGDTLAIKEGRGLSISIYVRVDNNWEFQTRITPTRFQQRNRFANDFALEGDLLVVGTDGDDSKANNSGAVLVYERSGTTWTKTVKLKPSDPSSYSFFGVSIAISEGRIAVGAPNTNKIQGNEGEVYTFTKVDGAWVQEAQIEPDVSFKNAQFGDNLTLLGDRLVIANRPISSKWYGVKPEKKLYIFEITQTGWNQVYDINVSSKIDGTLHPKLGNDLLLVGDTSDNTGARYGGGVLLYTKQGEDWIKSNVILNPEGAEMQDNFGSYISLSGNDILIGYKKGNSYHGAAYFYEIEPFTPQ